MFLTWLVEVLVEEYFRIQYVASTWSSLFNAYENTHTDIWKNKPGMCLHRERNLHFQIYAEPSVLNSSKFSEF